MYVSDYMYAVDPSGWLYLGNESENTDYRTIKDSNWLYMGLAEWSISSRTDLSNAAFDIDSQGRVYSYYVYGNYGARPTFYLKSDVEISRGNGTVTDPYRIFL